MQTANTIFLVRPSSFVFNAETAVSNAFQHKLHASEEEIKQQVLAEFEEFALTLKNKGVNVLVFEDTQFPEKPDAIFPNNWLTLHRDGTVILYPMCASNRRPERRQDVVEALAKHFQVAKVIDLSHYEQDGRFLEGTGSIIFDHDNKLAYACLSPRTDKELLASLCEKLNYHPVDFFAHDAQGQEIYHTNVMMCVGEKFAVICLSSITDAHEKAQVIHSLESTGHEIVDISFAQVNKFAGNMLALQSQAGQPLLAMSQSAFDCLTSAQKQQLEKFCELLPLTVKTIETIGGGSARCMIAEVFLPRLPAIG